MPHAIRTDALSKHFGSHIALDGLDLEVPAGGVFGFLGPNGAGKTTTIRILLGLSRPTAGTADVLGERVTTGSVDLRRRIGYLPGNLSLPERPTGAAHLADLASLRGLDLRKRHHELAERLDADLDRPMGVLSSGNRRKVGLIAALAHDPDLVVLDEPTSGMDPIVQRTFRDLAREAAAEGRTVFLSSHVLDEVQHTADRVAVLRRGRLVVEDRVATLLDRVQRTVVLTFDAPPPGHLVDTLTEIDGVMAAQADGSQVIVELAGPAGPLLGAVAPWRPTDLRTTEPDLEDVFLSLYDDDHEVLQ